MNTPKVKDIPPVGRLPADLPPLDPETQVSVAQEIQKALQERTVGSGAWSGDFSDIGERATQPRS